MTEDSILGPTIALSFDRAINYAFHQNAIPMVKELRICNDAVPRKDLSFRITTDPPFAEPLELRLQALQGDEEYRVSPLHLKLSHSFLAGLNERVSGWIRIEVFGRAKDGADLVLLQAATETISLLAHNEWCGLVSLPEILAAFVLPNDKGILPILSRASEILGEQTGRSALNGYQDKSRNRARLQVAAVYRAIAELGIRYINPPASFENTGQKVRFPTDVVEQRFGTCLDLVLLFAACCEQIGLNPLVLMHEGHAYAGCWLEKRTLVESATDDLQHIRKLAADELITVFETTIVASESPGTLDDAERLAIPCLNTTIPFRVALDIQRARVARILPLPIPGQSSDLGSGNGEPKLGTQVEGALGARVIIDPTRPVTPSLGVPLSRIDQWKSRLLDLSLRNRLLNFKATKGTIQILSFEPEHVEDELAANVELRIQSRPTLMSEDDPRNAATYIHQQKADALSEYLREELAQKRLHTDLEESEHYRRLIDIYRSARLALEENGTNTLFAAVGILEWRETEHSDRVLRAPLLLVPVELKRKSVIEGFTLRRVDEETRFNVTLVEMLRQHFEKDIPGLDPLPEDDSGVNVARVFQLCRDAVREMVGWEVKSEIWISQFSFTKFLLWKDLADRLNDLTRNPIVHHLVHESGLQFANPSDEIQPAQLDDQYHPREVFCLRGADSSQLAAVMTAAAGSNFVLEGPPGTGKSQTITNIIAHCLADGKRILFVAEKRAALDVVFRRLREEGLEPFCLELHSNKSGKKDVVAQFERSLDVVCNGNGTDWERRTSELAKLRSELNGYTRALHHCYPCGLSAYQCLDYLLPRPNAPAVRLDDAWPAVLQTPLHTLDRAREIVRRIQERSRPFLPISDHVLAPINREEWSYAWAEPTLDIVHELSVLTRDAAKASRDVHIFLGIPPECASRDALMHLDALADSLLAPEPVGSTFAVTPWNQLASELDNWIALTRERNDIRVRLASLLTQPTQSPAASAAPSPTQLACEDWSPTKAESIFATIREVIEINDTAVEGSRDLQNWLRLRELPATRSDIDRRMALVNSLLAALSVGSAFFTTPWDQIASNLADWTTLVRERSRLRSELKDYNATLLLALDLDRLELRWQSAQKSWPVIKGLRIGSIRRRLRSARLNNGVLDITTISATLNAALRLRAIETALAEAGPTAELHLEGLWASGEPDADTLIQARTWGASLHSHMLACAGDDSDWLTQFRHMLSSLFGQGASVFAVGTPDGNCLSRYRNSIGAVYEGFVRVSSNIDLDGRSIEQSPDYLGSVAAVLANYLQDATRLRAINNRFSVNDSSGQSCLGVVWNRGEPAIQALNAARAWGETLHSRMIACAESNSGRLSQLRQLLAELFSQGPIALGTGTNIGNGLLRYRQSLKKFNDTYEVLVSELRLQRDHFDNMTDHLGAVLAFSDSLPAAWKLLREWCSLRRACQEGLHLGLAPVIAKLESPSQDTLDLSALFEWSFRRAMLFSIIDSQPTLRDFFGQEHDERIDRFRQLDGRVATLTRDLVHARLAAGIPRDQKEDNFPKVELGLLRKEIAKKARQIPVRQLIGRIPKLLPRLKPCVLMSPLSVAQYLEPSHESFDLVIFDEASQIPVWDAVGAIARGKQLIVVGDPKQLPPTNFFSNVEDPDTEDIDSNIQQDADSILDELLADGLRRKRLQWHYRSRHEGLIAFSNRQYYENSLLTFPSPENVSGGISFKYLPDARYDKGKSRTNPIEARALVNDLVLRLRRFDGPCLSYGIVTFSQAQQRLVEDLLDEERRKFPEIEVHFSDNPPVDGEPVFVKNLENVQGDERDIILFSICYGPDESGRISLNFGPINRVGGERRLNVAITRAKREVRVFSSLRSDQIDLTRTRAIGVSDLKRFLDYAERGPKALVASITMSSTAEPESEFEQMVAERIRAEGFEVHHQVGCSGYRIDLGVVDPKLPGRYLLGVECDGATYHRAATARDRDKLRQSILEDLGWKLHRIWSTDWWHDANAATDKLLSTLNGLQRS